MKKRNLQSGFSLVEVMIASAIALAMILTLLGVFNLYFKTALANGEAVKGAYLAEEGIEAIRFMRAASWGNSIATLFLETDYGVAFDGTSWATTNDIFVGEFERYITLSAVQRDANDDIVSSGGTPDPNTILVTSTVAWPSAGATTTKTISTYITNIYDN